MRRLVQTFIMSAALLGATAAFAQTESMDEALIESASTPAQHEALAAQYQSRAADARKQAETHLRMAKRYGTTKTGLSQKPHCEKLAADFEDMAKNYDALAAGEKAAAK